LILSGLKAYEHLPHDSARRWHPQVPAVAGPECGTGMWRALELTHRDNLHYDKVLRCVPGPVPCLAWSGASGLLGTQGTATPWYRQWLSGTL
jgi:hypothetical protein